MTSRQNIFFIPLTIGLSLAASLLIGETAVRLFVPQSQWKFRDATSDWALNKRMGWVQKPNLDVVTHSDFGWTVRFQTNEDGLTPPSARRVKKEGALRIMFFGDSTVVGRSVPQDKTVSAQLEQLLQRKGIHAEVFNAGVQGYSTDQVLLRMEEFLPLYQPDIVFYGACDNDFSGNVSRVSYGQAKPMFRLKEDGELEEIPPELKEEINSFGGGWGKWLQYSALYRFLQPTLVSLRAQMGGWRERNLLGIASEIYYQPKSLDQIDWPIFAALVRRMNRVAEENRARFFFYSHPAIAEVWDPYIRDTERKLRLAAGQYDRYALERHLKKVAEETETEFIPLIDYFAARQSEGPFHLLPRDPHCNSKGNQLTAEALTQSVTH